MCISFVQPLWQYLVFRFLFITDRCLIFHFFMFIYSWVSLFIWISLIGNWCVTYVVLNSIGGVMASVIVSSAIGRRFELQPGQTKDYEIGICCFSAKDATLRRKTKPIWATCLVFATIYPTKQSLTALFCISHLSCLSLVYFHLFDS